MRWDLAGRALTSVPLQGPPPSWGPIENTSEGTRLCNPEGTVISLSGPFLWAFALRQPGEVQGVLGWGQVEARLQDQAGRS